LSKLRSTPVAAGVLALAATLLATALIGGWTARARRVERRRRAGAGA
jgi:hypothetical protein